jgi:hypothetical protein
MDNREYVIAMMNRYLEMFIMHQESGNAEMAESYLNVFRLYNNLFAELEGSSL